MKAAIREAIEDFRNDPDFNHIWVSTEIGGDTAGCGVWLKDGRDIKCVAVAQDILGNFTIVLPNGGIRQYLAEEVL